MTVMCCAAIACREGVVGRWTVRPGSTAPGAVTSFGVSDLQDCLSDCLQYQHCVAAEFTKSSGTCKHDVSSTQIDPTQISSSTTTDLFTLSRCIWTWQPANKDVFFNFCFLHGLFFLRPFVVWTSSKLLPNKGVVKEKQAVVRGTTNPAPCCHLPNDTDLLTA